MSISDYLILSDEIGLDSIGDYEHALCNVERLYEVISAKHSSDEKMILKPEGIFEELCEIYFSDISMAELLTGFVWKDFGMRLDGFAFALRDAWKKVSLLSQEHAMEKMMNLRIMLYNRQYPCCPVLLTHD